MVIGIRVVLFAVLALAVMGFVGTSLALAHSRMSSSCATVHVDSHGPLVSCHKGWFSSYPNMMKQGCMSVGFESGGQLWSCPVRVG